MKIHARSRTYHHSNQLSFLKDYRRKRRTLVWFLHSRDLWFSAEGIVYKPVCRDELVIDLKKIATIVPKSDDPGWLEYGGYEEAKPVEVYKTQDGTHVIQLKSEHNEVYIEERYYRPYFTRGIKCLIRDIESPIRFTVTDDLIAVIMPFPVNG